MPLMPTLPLVFDHSVMSEGAPTVPKCTVPDNSPSLMTLGPATFCQLVLTSTPAALACFSIRPSRSISISGRNATPNCCAMVTSAISARGAVAVAASIKAARPSDLSFIDLLPVYFFSLNSFCALVRTIFCRSSSLNGAASIQSAASLMSSNG